MAKIVAYDNKAALKSFKAIEFDSVFDALRFESFMNSNGYHYDLMAKSDRKSKKVA